MTEIKIDKGVPMPPPQNSTGSLHSTLISAMKSMAPGDSFAVPYAKGSNASAAATKMKKKGIGEFKCLGIIEGGEKVTRVWRVK